MAFPICKLKNISGEAGTWHSKGFSVDEIYQLPDYDRISWAMDDDIINAITDEDLQVHDSEGAVTGIAAQIAHLQDY